MASKTRRQRRVRGEGGFIKRRNHYYWRQQAGGKDISIALKNEDGTLCTTRQQAEAAYARGGYLELLDVKTKEDVLHKVAEFRQLEVIHHAKSEDAWELYLHSANRPNSGPRVLKEQQALLKRLEDWIQAHYHVGLASVTPEIANGQWTISGGTGSAHSPCRRQFGRTPTQHMTTGLQR